MKNPLWKWLLGLLLPATALGQTCAYQSLSKSFAFTVRISQLKPVGEELDSCLVTVTITDKRTHTQQRVNYTTTRLFRQEYGNCTGDTRVGNAQLFVADFNFDGRDDFAVLSESVLDGAPAYRFYVQQATGTFLLHHSLTEEVKHYPEEILRKRHELTTILPANAGLWLKTSFGFDSTTGEWSKMGERLVPFLTTP